MAKFDKRALKDMSVEELAELISDAQAYKREKATPSVLVKGYEDSCVKHATAFLTAARKMLESNGVPQKRFDAVDAQAKRIANWRTEALRVPVKERSRPATARTAATSSSGIAAAA